MLGMRRSAEREPGTERGSEVLREPSKGPQTRLGQQVAPRGRLAPQEASQTHCLVARGAYAERIRIGLRLGTFM
jgi:hypothetical protein